MATGERNAAYGLRFSGIEAADRLLVEGRDDWPLISVEVRRVDAVPPPSPPDNSGGVAFLGDGRRLVTNRSCLSATFLSTRPLELEDLVHPGLGHAAVHFGGWLGREVLHAGAFVATEGAWAVSGDSGSGKSSLLAALSLAGHPVLADDSLVLDGASAHAGPRCIDLRPDLDRPPMGGRFEPARAGSRLRLGLAAVDASVPLRGLIYLEWGPKLRVTALSPEQRLARILRSRLTAGHGRAAGELALLPIESWLIRRPRRWDAVPEAIDAIEGLTAHPRRVPARG